MPLRLGILSARHVHAPSYVFCAKANPNAELVGVYDADAEFLAEFSEKYELRAFDSQSALIESADAVIISGTNMEHADLIEACVTSGKPVLCEKPIAGSQEQYDRIQQIAQSTDLPLMTAFPCPFSPAFESAMAKVKNGDIGKVLAVNATNHGKCPGGWFTDKSLSGGGAMIDHVVHVADLLNRLLGERPESVQAIIGNNMYGQDWDDSAMVTVGFPSGVFATIDSSWSRPDGYKTWGDVTLKIVGEKGVIELDLFLQGLDAFGNEPGSRVIGFGSNLDQLMVDEFIASVTENRKPSVTIEDGLAASEVALKAYQSVPEVIPAR